MTYIWLTLHMYTSVWTRFHKYCRGIHHQGLTSDEFTSSYHVGYLFNIQYVTLRYVDVLICLMLMCVVISA